MFTKEVIKCPNCRTHTAIPREDFDKLFHKNKTFVCRKCGKPFLVNNDTYCYPK